MSRLRDQVVPIVAAALVVAVGVSVVLLLRVANTQGIDALRRAKLQQVEATANSFNARVAATLTSAAGLGTAKWQLTPGSAADERVLNTYAVETHSAQSGFFLINAADRVTDGVLLRPGRRGSRFAPPGWAQAKRRLQTDPVIVLPVSHDGFTTELPCYDFVVAIRGAGHALRGALVVEQAVTSNSAFEQEIAQLADPSSASAAWFFIDTRGSVVATTEDAGLGRPVEDHRYLTVPSGLTDVGNRIVVTADVPALGWRVVFRQNRGQFESGVSGPLQKAGLILVLLLLAIGLTLVVILVRRLRGAREQQRRLRELTRSQSEFVSVVSHELRTPVAGVLGFLQTTVDHWDSLSDAERLATVRRAMANARRLQAMTRDVLDTEAIESGRIGYSFQPVDLGAELETAVAASRDADPSHAVTLTAPAAPITVDADPDRLQQVLGNLLENARRNSPTSQPITVETEIVEDGERGPRARVSVIDRGPGVSPDSLERIFEKFVRGNDTAVTGTGLGLYIVRTIVEAHRGRIWCESEPGQRTAFVVELPLATTSARSAP